MKTLYIDCAMGAAGDMLTAALWELLPNREEYLEKLNALGIPGIQFTAEATTKCGILGTHMHVSVHGGEEHELIHEHLHEHAHEHSHESLHEHSHGHDHKHLHEHTHEEFHEHDHKHTHEHTHGHSHEHDHSHTHRHIGLCEIQHIVSHLSIDASVKEDILSVYQMIAEAESHAHGVPVSQIHFHEVGNMDAIADVTAVCLLMHEI